MDRSIAGPLLVWLIALSLPAQAQPAAAVDWCTWHHPCDWASHTAGVVVGSLAMDRLTPLDASGARWLIAAYYRTSPRLAAWISRRDSRRRFCRRFVVTPALRIARRLQSN